MRLRFVAGLSAPLRVDYSVNMAYNVLYLAVLPMIHLTTGLVDQVITVFPRREFATEFFPDEVDGYILMFTNRANQYLTGGHVEGYEIEKQVTADGRVVVKVTQNVN